MQPLCGIAGLSCLALSLVLGTLTASAQAAGYPERPVRLVVAYASGANADLTARKVTNKLSTALGQQIVIDNRAGAGGIIGTEAAARSAPDGYTLLFGTAQAMVTNLYLYSKLPYDPIKDFTPIARIGVHPQFFVVPLTVPVNSIKELITYIKARPGQINYASSGSGTNAHLSSALFANMAGLEVAHVPYNNPGQLLTDLVSGRTQFMSYSYPPLAAMIKAGKLRVLSTTGQHRSELFPDAPTMTESGLSDFIISGWEGIFAPMGTGNDVLDRVYGGVAETLKDPDVITNLKSDGGEPALATPAEFIRFMRSEVDRYRKIVAVSGAKAE